MSPRRRAQPTRLGLRENLPQFLLLVTVNALVGGMFGQERTVVPLLGEAEFGLAAGAGMLSFIAVFGLTKAVVNYYAGAIADRYGRKPVLMAGWLIGLPVPLLLMWAPAWGWIVFANLLLGVNQGLTWSMTVIMKIDLVGPRLRGTAMGFNEAAGYAAVAGAAWATGAIAEHAGLRPAPFLLGLAFAVLGLGLSAAFVRETTDHVSLEHAAHESRSGPQMTARQVFAVTSWKDRSLSTACRAGLVNNLNEGMAWGLFPLLFATGRLSLSTVGLLTAIAPGVWGLGQLGTGALSDRIGRKGLIAAGQLTEAAGLAVIALGDRFAVWVLGSVLFGAGTAMAYPTLIAAVSDVAPPVWRGAAIGVYRLWRDVGFAVGALLSGVLAGMFTMGTAIIVVAIITAASGVDVIVRMRETLPPNDPQRPIKGEATDSAG
jgi:MFS family permease